MAAGQPWLTEAQTYLWNDTFVSRSFSRQHPAGRAGSGERHGGDQEGVLRGKRQSCAAEVSQQQHRAAPLSHSWWKNCPGQICLPQISLNPVKCSVFIQQRSFWLLEDNCHIFLHFIVFSLPSRTCTTPLWSTLERTLKPLRPPCSSRFLSGSSKPTRSDNSFYWLLARMSWQCRDSCSTDDKKLLFL